MVFYDIGNFDDVVSGHRIIIYYIENGLCGSSAEKLSSSLKSILESLDKKNDDVLLIEVSKQGDQFKHFQAIYNPVIFDGITLFAINGEGIPVTSLNIASEKDILKAISSLIQTCELKTILDSLKIGVGVSNSEHTHSATTLKLEEPMLHSPSEEFAGSTSSVDSASEPKRPRLSTENDDHDVLITTKLQIRLPDGSKDVQKFDKEALLNEVQSFITSKHKLKDYDLKTFNSPIFSGEDYEKTLLDLGLHPNGVIIVVLKKQVSPNGNGRIGDFVQTGVLQLITSTNSLIRFVQDFLFKIWMKFFSATNSDGNVRNSIQSQNARPGQEQSSFQKKSKRYDSKPFGNIHTLRRNDDSDDDNNRYNGNSTQQK